MKSNQAKMITRQASEDMMMYVSCMDEYVFINVFFVNFHIKSRRYELTTFKN